MTGTASGETLAALLSLCYFSQTLSASQNLAASQTFVPVLRVCDIITFDYRFALCQDWNFQSPVKYLRREESSTLMPTSQFFFFFFALLKSGFQSQTDVFSFPFGNSRCHAFASAMFAILVFVL